MLKNHKSIPVRAALILSLILGIIVTVPVFAGPSVIYVDQNAQGLKDGSSWINAYTDLQSALTVATPGYEIWVAAGIYKPTTAGTDRSASFILMNDIAIYGGFLGNESSLSERNSKLHATVLSGDIGVLGDPRDNSTHVVQGGNTNSTAILDGFTIQGGYADGSMTDNVGAGISNFYGNPTLRNLTIDNNSAGTGSAIYNYNSSPTLLNVTISNNGGLLGSRGGAMVNDTNSSPSLTNVTFYNNSSVYLGGAMLNFSNSNASMVNVTFVGNSANDTTGRGGAIYNYGSNPSLLNVTFNGNSAFEGGAIYNDSNSNPTIVNSILYGDSNIEIFNFSGTALVTFSIVQGGYAGIGNQDADPLLGPLQDNGGYTWTKALGTGSSAIDTGDLANCPSTDQRGFARPSGSGCDIGAYEYIQTPPTDTPSPTPTNTLTPTPSRGKPPTKSPVPTKTPRK